MALKKNPKYDLKRKYKRVFEISLILALIILIGAFKFFPKWEAEVIKSEGPQEIINVQDVDATKQEAAPPPPPKPPIPIESVSDDVLEDVEIESTDLDEKAQVTAPPPPPPVQKEEDKEEAEPVFFQAVEKMPEPIGGIEGIQKRIVYPEMARRAGVQGRVFVKAFVDEAGNVWKVELVKGIGAGCDEAAIAAVKETRFSPGSQRGKPVKVQVAIPILFKIQ